MEDILIVVDMQNDFIDGVLKAENSTQALENIKEYIKDFKGEIIFTKDTHYNNYLETQEGKYLPIVHCIENTEGWNIHKDLVKYANKVFIKNTFASTDLIQYLKEKTNINKLIFVGICTDICVISNAMIAKAYFPEVKIEVIEKCCAGVNNNTHNSALTVMKSCQIDII